MLNIFERLFKIEIGDGTNIRGELLLLRYGGRIKIGENCYTGDHSASGLAIL